MPSGGGGSLVVFDAATRAVIKQVDAGAGVGGILVQPDGSRAYGSSSRDNVVVVVDLNTLQVVGRVNAGNNPDGLAWTTASQ
jgi:YVTN family beta-propeller protein